MEDSIIKILLYLALFLLFVYLGRQMKYYSERKKVSEDILRIVKKV